MTCSSIDLLLHSSVDDRPESLLLVVGDDGVGEKGQGDGGAYRGSISANKSAPGSPPSAKSLLLPFALMLTTYEYLIHRNSGSYLKGTLRFESALETHGARN